jgi:hypothetical protein
MRRRDDGGNARCVRGVEECEGLLVAFGAVVDACDQMAVNIDEARNAHPRGEHIE